MSLSTFNFLLNFLSTACWPVCFWWMYRISAKQNSLLDQLKEQTERIERFSKAEHDLIREVHPRSGRSATGWRR